MNDNDVYTMWLSRIVGIGFKKYNLLLQHFGTIENVFNSNRAKLKETNFLSACNIENILKDQNEYIIKNYLDELNRENIKYISIENSKYPLLLKEIIDPPIGLYLKGTLPSDKNKRISIIGSRKCSEYGLTVASKISKELAKRGVVIISGMATGIDSMAHKATIDVNGCTIAVLGCGVDVCYPSENRILMDRILEKGAIVSEYPPKTSPQPRLFPARNRIISGMSEAVLVIEAAKKSGTSITIGQALEQGRQVLAVPGNITNVLSSGTNEAIKEGAIVVTEYKDVLDAIGFRDTQYNKQEDLESLSQNIQIEEEEKIIYNAITNEGITVDKIVQVVKKPVSEVNYLLTMLEIEGLITKLPGQKYMRSL